MSEMRELKACPFCAGEAELIDDRLRFIVKCKACGLVGPLPCWRGEFDDEGAGEPTSIDLAIWREEALSLWNTRTLSTSLDQDRERVARAIEEVIWPLADWDGERAVAANAADKAADAAFLAIRQGGENG